MRLKGKVIFLTGGSTGIGYDCAVAYAREGARVALVARHETAAIQAASNLGGGHMGVSCDVSKDDQAKAEPRREESEIFPPIIELPPSSTPNKNFNQ